MRPKWPRPRKFAHSSFSSLVHSLLPEGNLFKNTFAIKAALSVSKIFWNLANFNFIMVTINEPRHEISNNVVCATSKASDQPAYMRSLIRAFACRSIIL